MARLPAGPRAGQRTTLKPKLRVLLSLFMVTTGAVLGGLGLSGYYDPRALESPAAEAVVSPLATQGRPATLQFTTLQARQRFLAIDEAKPPAAAKVKAVAKTPPPNAKPAVKVHQVVKDKRPQQAAVPWPWNLFGN